MQTQRVDGRAIARGIESELSTAFSTLKQAGTNATLEVLSFGDDPATRSFLGIKKRVADRIGVDLVLHELPDSTVENIAEEVLASLVEAAPGGIVVQLPLPPQIDKATFLNLIPEELDVDCISPRSLDAFAKGKSKYISPVALAVEEILRHHDVELVGKKSAIVGFGDLVGKPVSFLLNSKGLDYTIFDSNSDLKALNNFDIVISGVGRPGLITGELVKEGVVLIDAGTSEAQGKLMGDVHESAREKASLVTPVPGGVGPITVVKLFENLLQAIKSNHNAQ